MVSLNGSWDNWSDYDIRPGEFGVGANITYEGANVTYSVYRDGQIIESGITENLYLDSNLINDQTYEYALTATYSDGEESEQSQEISVTPFADTVHEESYDDGTFEGGFCSDSQFASQDSCVINNGNWEYGLNIGSGKFSAVRFSTSYQTETITRFKWYQHGSGGAFYIKIWDNVEPYEDFGIDGVEDTSDEGEGDGVYNIGENFTDLNGNGQWDIAVNLPGTEIFSKVQVCQVCFLSSFHVVQF